MATKTAGIKLTLSAAGFSTGLTKLEGDSKRSAKSIGQHFQTAMSDGLKNGLESVRSTFSTIKNTVMSIGGLAGGLGVAELLRGAVTTEAGFRKLAFSIRAGTGEAIDFRDVQREVQATALATGQATDELGRVMQSVFQETGDAEFARNTIGTIATAATGAHEPLETMGSIAGTLNEKFGITEENLGAALAAAVGLGNKGGVAVSDLGEKLGVMGAFAKEAGLQGEDGFAKTLALMNLADNATGNLKRGLGAVGGLLETLSSKSERVKIGAKLGIDGSKLKGDATQQIGAILAATGGKSEKLEKAFGGETLKLLVDMGKTYATAFDATAGSVKDKSAAALAAYEASLQAAGKSSLTYGDLQTEAAAEMETTEKKMAVALEKLRQAFAKPEITDALTKLMSKLPALADIVASLVDFAVEHPALAGAGALGASVGGSVMTGAANSAFDALIKGAFKSGGQVAATEVASGLAGSAGGGLASSVVGALTSGPGLALIGVALAAYFVASAIDAADKERDAEKERAAQAGEMFHEGGGGESGFGAESNSEVWVRNAETGQLEKKTADELGPEFDAIKDRQREAAKGPPPQSPDEFRQSFYGPGSSVAAPPKLPGAGGGMSAADARLFADMLGSKKLRVEITNPEALRGPGAGAPAPGNAPRK